ncbi:MULTISPECIES: GTP cyclohydrolase FolE2 [Vitreoscilla]|uniref:GTP cyclohydrolase FolE2 n=1 Tax=Vitreoscilla stercoraria TaxID=61 RepID=A0ABY4ECN5_VITST|nr:MULTISPECIES: GTP cyclohydrolase FolE2 [Vitreoscilla]AUZ04048.2 GTP cyclohydrolase FolE2 [Vitreoscilla sp. C1]UOO93149.1 GTP cyclohydrolase FolE2 [Vitreoscilla stercoraria]
MNAIPDVQSSVDSRNLPIQQVGIKNLRFPIHIATASGPQTTVANLTMTVFLPADQKGTHMSRFVQLMEDEAQTVLDAAQLQRLTQDMLQRLDSHSGRLDMSFPYFRSKTAPISGIKSLLDYDVRVVGEIKDGQYQSQLQVLIPVTSLCPCSKEISQYGAHNQRSHVTINLTHTGGIQVDELIDIVEEQASCQLYGLLKRPDEKYVTERAYENPKFVEDMVRDVAATLRDDERVLAFTVESENFESIHNHSAYAVIQYP